MEEDSQKMFDTIKTNLENMIEKLNHHYGIIIKYICALRLYSKYIEPQMINEIEDDVYDSFSTVIEIWELLNVIDLNLEKNYEKSKKLFEDFMNNIDSIRNHLEKTLNSFIRIERNLEAILNTIRQKVYKSEG